MTIKTFVVLSLLSLSVTHASNYASAASLPAAAASLSAHESLRAAHQIFNKVVKKTSTPEELHELLYTLKQYITQRPDQTGSTVVKSMRGHQPGYQIPRLPAPQAEYFRDKLAAATGDAFRRKVSAYHTKFNSTQNPKDLGNLSDKKRKKALEAHLACFLDGCVKRPKVVKLEQTRINGILRQLEKQAPQMYTLNVGMIRPDRLVSLPSGQKLFTSSDAQHKRMQQAPSSSGAQKLESKIARPSTEAALPEYFQLVDKNGQLLKTLVAREDNRGAHLYEAYRHNMEILLQQSGSMEPFLKSINQVRKGDEIIGLDPGTFQTGQLVNMTQRENGILNVLYDSCYSFWAHYCYAKAKTYSDVQFALDVRDGLLKKYGNEIELNAINRLFGAGLLEKAIPTEQLPPLYKQLKQIYDNARRNGPVPNRVLDQIHANIILNAEKAIKGKEIFVFTPTSYSIQRKL